MKPHRRTAARAVGWLAFTVFSGAVGAADDDATIDRRSGRKLVLAPDSDLYPRNLADPRRPTFSLVAAGHSSSEVPQAGDLRFGVRMGGRYGILRLHPQGAPDRGLQFDVEAGWVGQFDIDNSLDVIGWDGVYGLLLSWRTAGKTAIRVGTLHDSGHVGDEYAQRTGRQRINYTREELIFGLTRWVGTTWRWYAETGYAYTNKSKLQEPGRFQLGLEYASDAILWKNRLAWYTALDNSFSEERDWMMTSTLQLGLVLPAGNEARHYRVGIELFNGRSPLGEFSFRDETRVGLGWWFDL